MALTINERAARWRARKRGEEIPKMSPGVKKGYKQTTQHIEKRIKYGENHHNWLGDKIVRRSGRTRAERLFVKEPCEICGEDEKRIDRHHIDGDTKNNERTNIKFLCRRCHMQEDGRYENFITIARENQPKAVAARWR